MSSQIGLDTTSGEKINICEYRKTNVKTARYSVPCPRTHGKKEQDRGQHKKEQKTEQPKTAPVLGNIARPEVLLAVGRMCANKGKKTEQPNAAYGASTRQDWKEESAS